MVKMYEKSIGSYVKSFGILLYFVYKVMMDFKLQTEGSIGYIVTNFPLFLSVSERGQWENISIIYMLVHPPLLQICVGGWVFRWVLRGFPCVCTCLIARRTLTLDCPSPGYHLFFASPDRTLTDLRIVECVPESYCPVPIQQTNTSWGRRWKSAFFALWLIC